MLVEMLMTRRGSADGSTVNEFKSGGVYEMGDSLARRFIRDGSAREMPERADTYWKRYATTLEDREIDLLVALGVISSRIELGLEDLAGVKKIADEALAAYRAKQKASKPAKLLADIKMEAGHA